MTFPPGWPRLLTNPAETGSPLAIITIGIVWVASCAACAVGWLVATITSTLSLTSSAAAVGSRSYRRSALRQSMTTLVPGTYPRSLRPLSNDEVSQFGQKSSQPMCGTFDAGCPDAEPPRKSVSSRAVDARPIRPSPRRASNAFASSVRRTLATPRAMAILARYAPSAPRLDCSPFGDSIITRDRNRNLWRLYVRSKAEAWLAGGVWRVRSVRNSS